ncbi:glycoside hydrolase family 5 protein [Annulohypoxylon maeteangense]|uniref:glycoside hydrolase family 5 protein n=1 Tax=Annulohypoxylon maeteangense TaxID=1927788 RepID=UPI0020089781|nr:glycoside hydrolase family 5 protein [Annulohypoxylon maeteangense]KAI0887934.1 glycoside hydrolase family 5 protein [Annulohypoxylon maeteangense]
MLSKSVVTAVLVFASARVTTAIPLESTSESAQPSKRWLNSGKVRGVNLGSQFIIEPWMAGDEWKSMGCSGDDHDEWSCVQHLGQEAANAAFKNHWNTWTTQEDINLIKSYGLNTVRIPVGYWIHEELVQSDEHFPQGGLSYLDRLVGWCADAGLYVIMDLHGGPGSQSVRQSFTGHTVDNPGFYTSANYERAYQFLEWMTERIHTNESYRTVGALELINEPVSSRDYPSQAAGMIANYYPTAWTRIRGVESRLNVAEDHQVHIQMMDQDWGSGNPSSNLPSTTNALYDDHRYLKWDPSVDKTKSAYMSAACSDYRGGNDVIVGEWSISVADDVENGSEFQIDGNPPDQVEWYQKFWAAQVTSYEKSGGWVFWSWKCNWIGGRNEWRWCYKSAVEAKVIPMDAGSAASLNPCSS